MLSFVPHFQTQCLGNWSKEAKLAGRVILLLQGSQAILAPFLTTIPDLGVLITIRVVDVCSNIRNTTSLVKNLTQLVAEILRLLVEIGSTGLVSDQGSSQQMSITESKCTRFAVNCLDTLNWISLEHEKRAIEGRGALSGRGKDLVGFLLRSNVI